MQRNLTLAASASLAFIALAGTSSAGDWRQFRGSDHSGVADGDLPLEWSSEVNVRWKVDLPGVAWSSPIIVGNQVILTTAVTENQRRPGGYGPPGGGRGPGGGRPGRPDRTGPGGGPGRFQPPRAGEVLSGFFQQMINVTEEQAPQLERLQAEVDEGLDEILSEEQASTLEEPRPGGRGPRGGRFVMPTPGRILAESIQESLELTDEQSARLAALQESVDAKVSEILDDAQQEQLTEIRERFARGPGQGGGGRGGPGRPGGFGRGGSPPDDVYRWEVICLDRSSGDVLWSKLALEGKPRIPTQPSNTYATETPVTDGERVYTYFAMHGLYCYDLVGNLLWQKDLGAYPMMAGWGTASSPVLDGNRLFILCDNEKQSFLAAFDKVTGEELWRVERSEGTTWSSPVVWKNQERTELVTLGSPKLRSYDPATGEQLWELTVGEGQCSASPVATQDLLVAGLRGQWRQGARRLRRGGWRAVRCAARRRGATSTMSGTQASLGPLPAAVQKWRRLWCSKGTSTYLVATAES